MARPVSELGQSSGGGRARGGTVVVGGDAHVAVVDRVACDPVSFSFTSSLLCVLQRTKKSLEGNGDMEHRENRTPPVGAPFLY
jgi:hypothetical protein